MSLVFAPTGLRFVGTLGNNPFSGGTTAYPLTTNNTVALAMGDPVALVAGSITKVAATPVSGTLSANTPVGFVLGFEYNNPLTPQSNFTCSQILPANAISSLGFTNVVVLVADAPDARFAIQANGSVTTALGLGATIALGFTAADTLMKTSRVYADFATLSQSATTLALKITGFVKDQDNAPGDANTKLICKWNSAVHYYSVSGTH